MNRLSDFEEREKALDPLRSFIVQAPAGSGKTELLIRRFLMLLERVDRPEQILAITFTRKAAGEMRRRILSAIEKAEKGEPPKSEYEKKTYKLAKAALGRDKKKKWNLLETPSRLRVQTIDALCSSLTRQMPLLSRLGGQPDIVDNPDKFYREAARRTISKIGSGGRDGEAVREALRHLDNAFAALEKRLIVMLQRREQWMRHVDLKNSIDNEVMRAYLEGSVRRLVDSAIEKVKEKFPSSLLEEAVDYGRYAASNLIGQGSGSTIVALDLPKSQPDPNSEDLPAWRGIRDLLLTRAGEWRKPAAINKTLGFPPLKNEEAVSKKEGFKNLLERLSGDYALREVLDAIGTLPDGSYDKKEWEILNDLLHLLPLAEKELMKLFAVEGVADFQTLSRAAVQSLGSEDEPTDLMLALDLQIQHILVDEYQDTSRTQLALLEALTRGWAKEDGRTLFLVGDPMQSIYLFREAEVGLFLEAREEGIGAVRPESIKLKSNFRSQEGIVDWVNDTFETAFPREEDRFLGSVRYERFDPVLERLAGDAVNIRIYEERDDEKEASEIVDLIRGLRNNYRDETIAVLARSRSHLTKIIKYLNAEKVDFMTIDLDPLIERPVIQDLIALLRALMHPCDRTAWLAVLRAPFCGLALADIHALCRCDSKRTVLELMQDEGKINSLSGDGRERVLKLRRILGKALPFWGKTAPRVVLEGLWIELGGPACIEDDAMTDAEAFFDMIDRVTEAGGIESLEILEARISELFATHGGTGDNPVEVLTIHKAKGLEYDHVILPGIGKPPRHQAKVLVRSMERGGDLLLAPVEGAGIEGESAIYGYLGRFQSEKALLEQTRLFYVAATRAKKRLYLFGHLKDKAGDELKIEKRSFLSAMRCAVKENVVEGREENGREAAENVERRSPLLLKRLASDWRNTEPVEKIHADVERIPNVYEERPEFLWAGESIKHLGTIIHRYFCRIAREGLDKWNSDGIEKELKRMAAALRQLGLNGEEAGRLAGEGIEILKKSLSDGRGRWILGKHRKAWAEIPLSAVMDGKIVHRILDRTFIDEEDNRWIIDFKISRHEGSDIGKFLATEKERYRPQLEEYETILRASGETRKIRMGLYYPAQSIWIEW